jgi:3'-phosphoadenosine 5'-phosphosulfate sulfotransferase (PAPS reductase)/FAD synthetase
MTPSAVEEQKLTSTDVDRDPEVSRDRLNHIQLLEAESIHIFREVASEFQNPVVLYSIGKDSSVMLRLAQKAFYPGPTPFPLLHVDTGYKFREMLEFRDRYTAELGLKLIVWRNEDALADGANPIKLGTQRCCGLLKTQALLDGLRAHGFDAAFGGARRDASSRFAIKQASGIRRTSVLSCGRSSMAKSARVRASASFRYRTGPNWTSGITSTSKRFRSCRCILRSRARCWCVPIR